MFKHLFIVYRQNLNGYRYTNIGHEIIIIIIQNAIGHNNNYKYYCVINYNNNCTACKM